MNEIKIYEELSYIYTYDDKVYPSPVAIGILEKMLNWTSKFINLWSDLINVSNIKRVETKKVWTIENALLQIQDVELREKMTSELNKRKQEGKTKNMENFKKSLDRITN